MLNAVSGKLLEVVSNDFLVSLHLGILRSCAAEVYLNRKDTVAVRNVGPLGIFTLNPIKTSLAILSVLVTKCVNCCKNDCVLKFTILAKSIVKDKYTRSFSFILDMGQKSVITIGTLAPIIFQWG